MKKRAMSILTAMILTTLTGCGTQAQAQTTSAQIEDNTTIATESVDTPIESTAIEETSSIPESETIKPIYIDYEDLFLADNYLKVGRERLEAVNTDSLDKTYVDYVLSESTDLYNFEGTWVGYSKPDIKVILFGTNDKWAKVSFAKTILYIPKDKFDAIATLAVEEPETEEIVLVEAEEPKQETTPSKPKTETPVAEKPATETSATEKPVTSETVVTETPATQPTPESEAPVVVSTKYTPEEAIAVYRSIMEANGIEWDPSIKEFASWGTGWIYLEKGEPERAGDSDVESFRMGDSTGNSWTQYYLEVTGYDENAVYITQWHCD